MINLTDYIKAKKIENKKIENKERKKYKNGILELEALVFNAIIDNRTYIDLHYSCQDYLLKIIDKLYFERKPLACSWEYRIKMNLLSLWLLKKEVKKVKKWKIK